MESILKIAESVWGSFLHLWPYFLMTIPLAVAINLSGLSKLIKKTLNRNPFISILLATVLGAFSPFCSCGVIPVVSSLLISGVPLAPVMSFWIASPSMDPEIFLLSIATIGWELSIWRLVSTFVLSLVAGYTTHFLFNKGILGQQILRTNSSGSFRFRPKIHISEMLQKLRHSYAGRRESDELIIQVAAVDCSGDASEMNCCIAVKQCPATTSTHSCKVDLDSANPGNCGPENITFLKRLFNETGKASMMVAKFMGLAFLINALISLYVPEDFVVKLIDGDGPIAVIAASIVGVPVYTNNAAALPFISGLLSMGMNQGAALAFLISGPTTTLPAMVAVWGIVRRKVFVLYIFFSLAGSILFGILFNLFA